MPKTKYPVINGQKECGDCKLFKPISEYIPARNHYNAYCKDCRKIRAAKYRKKPEAKKKAAEYNKNYIKDQKNRNRKNEYNRKRNKKQYVKNKRNLDRRNWSLEQKRKAIEYKGGKCIICNYNACYAALDFHHLNPLEKEKPGTGSIKSYQSFEKNKKELDKCVLVCCRCHREIHAGFIKIDGKLEV
jgi:hypothetical protein